MSLDEASPHKNKLWARAIFAAHLVMALGAYLESVFPAQNPLYALWIRIPLNEQILAVVILDIWFILVGYGTLRLFSWNGGFPSLLSSITEFRGRRGMYAFLLMVLVPALVLFRVFTIKPNAVASWAIINGFLLSALLIGVIGGGKGVHPLRPLRGVVGAPVRLFALFRQGTKRTPRQNS